MRKELKKAIVLFGTVCMLSATAAGCGSSPAAQTGGAAPEKTDGTLPADGTGESENGAEPEEPQGNAGGKWHILEPEVAAAVDADFKGEVWRIAEGAFSIAETKVQLLDDGSLASSSPSSNADIPDSQLIQVIFDDDTHFYVRSISGNGESSEDTEAGFQDLKEHMSVDLKGSFVNDVFYATEVRIIRIS